MKSSIKYLIAGYSFLIFITSTTLALTSDDCYSQSTAKDWFEKGLKTSDNLSRKQYLIKAIESDSNFVDAYFRLGEVLISSNQIELAESIFKLGLEKAQVMSDITNEARILIELATITRNRREYENAIKYLSRADKLQITPDLRAIIKYDLGTIYMFQSKFVEATENFETGQKLAPQLNDKFVHALALARSEGKIEIWYREAENLFQKKHWDQAFELYQKVALISMSYKDVELKLRLLKQKLQSPQNESELDEIYARGITQLLKKDYKGAITTFEMLIKIAPGFKDVTEKLQVAREHYIPEHIKIDLTSIYQKGVNEFNQRNWKEALNYFNQVIITDSNFQNVNKLIQQTEENLKQQNRQIHVENFEILELDSIRMTISNPITKIDTQQEFRNHYLQGIQYAKQSRWTQALLAFDQAKSFNKNSDSLIKQINYAREQLKNINQPQLDESKFSIVEGRRWSSIWLIGLTTFISIIIFLLIFRRYLKRSDVMDS